MVRLYRAGYDQRNEVNAKATIVKNISFLIFHFFSSHKMFVLGHGFANPHNAAVLNFQALKLLKQTSPTWYPEREKSLRPTKQTEASK
jgi:hypothetical protein